MSCLHAEAIAMTLTDCSPSFEDAAELYDLMASFESIAGEHGLAHPQTVTVAKSLAAALWKIGEIGQAISFLRTILDQVSDSDPLTRIDLLDAMGQIHLACGHLDAANVTYREAVEWCVRCSDAGHARLLKAKSDLATVLFELGENDEAIRLEQDAFESARIHLGKTHPVTCMLAWNRALSHERLGDPDSARRTLVDHLVWLLAEDPGNLATGQNTIRNLISERLQWERAPIC
jgi:tetratricopeptide (TPR) repeat protein